jgi:hypothetical protein
VGKDRANKKIARIMGQLADDEKSFLRRFYFPNREGHITAWPHEIGNLEFDGVVFCPGDSGLKDQIQTYCLTEAAQRYVAEHQTFLAELEKTNPHRY